MINEKPTIYNAPAVYNLGGGGGVDTYGVILIDAILYPTVKIGSQEWTAKNLVFAPSGIEVDGTFYNSSPKAASYGGNKTPFYYGYYYNYKAIQFFEANKSNYFPGWRIPTTTDWNTLFNFLGGANTSYDKLVIKDYDANNSEHTSIILNGYRISNNNNDLGVWGHYACLDNNGTGMGRAGFSKSAKTANTAFFSNFNIGVGIRLIKE